ncbi:hypothetical protein QKU58_gp097 [Pyramimonas orientalis virus]|uniref:Uncharacterized protein n=1 Tax=Pyramimonas orientalis virus 01B TaxID=3134525 RepID=A0A7M3UNH7_9VIRU|nr:hypothetical protein QKU58_gp097 [Pyramimonas orientalis virus]QOI90234.1 hypothetical protein HWQ62_00097 [Pyramimonas orientalis virus]
MSYLLPRYVFDTTFDKKKTLVMNIGSTRVNLEILRNSSDECLFDKRVFKRFFKTLLNIIHGASSNRRKQINIKYYQTFNKKCLPPKRGQELTSKHVNSGLCYTNSGIHNLNIVIHRHEEFYKVLVHEMLHLYDVIPYDETIQKTYENIYPGISHLNVNESFVELNAIIINSIIIHSIHSIPFNFLIEREYKWSCNQMNKLLHHFGTKPDIDDINNSAWKESTAAFSYYILKTILMQDTMFNKWKFNPNITNKKQFENVNKKSLMMTINDVNNHQNLLKEIANDKIINKTQ